MKRVFLGLVVLVLLGLVACSPAPPAADIAPTQPAAESTGIGDFPPGKFVDPKDKFRGFYFYEDGVLAFFDFGSIVVESSFTIDGNIMTDRGVPDSIDEGCNLPATYEWAYDGKNLSFNLVGEDPCANRMATIDGSTWVYEGAPPER